jgi:hypothetical protein
MLEKLDKAIIVTPEKIGDDIVTINSIVKFKDLTINMDIQLKIIYLKNANINKKYVPILSPVGTALPGAKRKILLIEILQVAKKSIILRKYFTSLNRIRNVVLDQPRDKYQDRFLI